MYEEIPDQELWKEFKSVGLQALVMRKKFASYLPEILRRGVYKKEFHSIYECAARLGGLSVRHVDEILNTYKKIKDKPKLCEAFAKEGWSKVRVIASLA